MAKFAKYHGCGNDFILINQKDVNNTDYSTLAEKWCHRNTGIGADGLIIMRENPEPDIPAEMIIINSDGTVAPMCGNGIRCFAQYCYDENIITKDIYPVKTGAGIMIVSVQSRDPFKVEIDMGKPDFNPESSAIDTDLPEFINQKLDIDQWFKELGLPEDVHAFVTASTFFMGTIHTVIWNEEDDSSNPGIVKLGELLIDHPKFKEKTNVNFVDYIDRDSIRLTTVERGVGLTAACGTGACASVVYGIREGRLNKKVKVLLPYGELIITQKEDGTVFMQGPSQKVADGECFI